MTNLNSKTRLQFGKHRGSTVKDVMDQDMDYMIWVKANLNLTFSKDVIKRIKEASDFKQQREFDNIEPFIDQSDFY
jgi:hypothetical protein